MLRLRNPRFCANSGLSLVSRDCLRAHFMGGNRNGLVRRGYASTLFTHMSSGPVLLNNSSLQCSWPALLFTFSTPPLIILCRRQCLTHVLSSSEAHMTTTPCYDLQTKDSPRKIFLSPGSTPHGYRISRNTLFRMEKEVEMRSRHPSENHVANPY